MIGLGAPAVGGPNDLDALLHPPPALPYAPGPRARVHAHGDRQGDRGRARACSSPPGRTTARCPGPCSARPRATPCGSTSSTPAPTRTRSTSTASTRRTWTASSRSCRPGGEFTYEFEARPYGMQLYHCHATPLKKHIHKGLYGALIIDPKEPRAPAQELVMVMNGYDTDGDGGEQLLHRQRPHVLLRALPDPGQALRARARLPRQPDRVRPDQLVPPARRLLPLLPDRLDRPLRVHGHGHAVPGPARHPRDRVLPRPARSCSTRTSRSSRSSAGWATSTSSTDGGRHDSPLRARVAALGARADRAARARRRRVRLARRRRSST